MSLFSWNEAFHSLGQQLRLISRRSGQFGVAAWLGLAGVPAVAQTPPLHWQNYASQAGQTVHAYIQEMDSPGAEPLRTWALSRPDQAVGPLRAAFWIDAKGRIPKLELESVGDADIDRQLKVVLGQLVFAHAPPPDMPQPLRLQLYWQYSQASE